MESAGEAGERVFDDFREDGFLELLGTGDGGHRLRVLQGEEEGEVGVGGFIVRCPPAYPPPSSAPSYRMLCFGGDEGFTENGSINGSSRKSSESCSPVSSSSSNVSLSKCKTEERRPRPAAAKREMTSITPEPAPPLPPSPTTATGAKKSRKDRPQGQRPPTSKRRTTKVRKEKLGERITALQQLVSPFGKSDTASVLHEALGYIRFLHDQVQVLSSPYLQRLPSSAHLHEDDGGRKAATGPDLRSRGLCVVPMTCTAHLATCNGADFWSPAMGAGAGDCHQPAVSKQ